VAEPAVIILLFSEGMSIPDTDYRVGKRRYPYFLAESPNTVTPAGTR